MAMLNNQRVDYINININQMSILKADSIST